MQKVRIVLKVGTSNLCNGEEIDKGQILNLAQIISELKVRFDVILVSSGAMASGYTKLQIPRDCVQNRQALASIGQPLLMESYRVALEQCNILSAQLLLTGGDFDSRKSTHFARNTIDVLLAHNVLPIINENDATATSELIFGDNDRLSAHVAHYFDAKLLVILSDIDGYFDKNPHQYPDAKILPIVHSISESALQESHTPHSHFATGGIVTKLMAADFLLKRNGMMFLSHGRKLDILRDLLLHGLQRSGTLFCPLDSRGLKALV
ncbi:glutamate 5-kinase [Helicobacter jaachi]|uniref:Glutamate 5-kinase n=1 Tax=Helicobacter jaachi TaxID=1677920 RepID=A0A4U8T8T9_9HELI|nr:glutamate 5-kinase [Helicobacter jaachi]TLD96023.1 glutamate 5-kinase [Helicobacter jaachi]